MTSTKTTTLADQEILEEHRQIPDFNDRLATFSTAQLRLLREVATRTPATLDLWNTTAEDLDKRIAKAERLEAARPKPVEGDSLADELTRAMDRVNGY